MPSNRRRKNRINLDRLCLATEAASRAEVLRRALVVYDYMISVHVAGGRIMIEEPDSEPARFMPEGALGSR